MTVNDHIREIDPGLKAAELTQTKAASILNSLFDKTARKGNLRMQNAEALDQLIGTSLSQNARFSRASYDLSTKQDAAKSSLETLSRFLMRGSAGAAAGGALAGPGGAFILTPLSILSQGPTGTRLAGKLMRAYTIAQNGLKENIYKTPFVRNLKTEIADAIANGDEQVSSLFPVPDKIMKAKNLKGAVFLWLNSPKGEKALKDVGGMAAESDEFRDQLKQAESQNQTMPSDQSAAQNQGY